MKQLFKSAAYLLCAGALVLNSCGKKDEDPKPDAPAPTPTCEGGSVKTVAVVLDGSTIAEREATKGKNFDVNVNKCDGSTIVDLDINAGDKDIDYIYVTQSSDNGNSSSLRASGTLKTGNDKEVTGGSSAYTYKLPSGIKAFTLKMPVPVRNSDAAVSDVYTIWVTNGTGDFLNTGKRTVIGPFTVTLKYKAATNIFVSGSNITVGDQNSSPPSYVSTLGTIGTLSGSALIESTLTGEERKTALNGVDINFVALNASGTTVTGVSVTDSKPFFVSVGSRSGLGFTVNTEGTNMTMFSEYTGSASFASMTGSDIASLPAPSASKIMVENNKIYIFSTQDGRKGVVRVTNLSASGPYTATLDVKVQAN